MTDQDIAKVSMPSWVTKQIIEEFIEIRDSGMFNMFDFRGVQACAKSSDMELGNIDRSKYLFILSNFDGLMQAFGVEEK